MDGEETGLVQAVLGIKDAVAERISSKVGREPHEHDLVEIREC